MARTSSKAAASAETKAAVLAEEKTAAPAKESKAAETKKTTAKKTTKAAAEKEAAEPKKTAVKKTESKAAAKKEAAPAVNTAVVFEYGEKKIVAKELLAKAMESFQAAHADVVVEEMQLYVNADESCAYIVVNGTEYPEDKISF